MSWNEIKTREDIDAFMDKMGGFHDGCLKELRFESGAYVGENLAMMPINTKRNVYVILQRQYKDPSAIEMLFADVEWLNLRPAGERYTCEIFGAHMCIEDDLIVWFDCADFKDSYRELYDKDVTWIKAHKVFWRAADEYLGEPPVYGAIR